MTSEQYLKSVGVSSSNEPKGLLRFFKGIFPYLIILFASFLPFSIYFKGSGINTGDDVWWHLIYTWDLNYGMDHGFSGISTSHTFFGFMAYDTYLFYAPFPHYFVICFYRIFRSSGLTIVDTLKMTAIFSVFLSGVFTFKLAKKISGGNVGISLAAALMFVFLPYRLYNFFYRMAYCEAIAEMFIPMLFLGIVGILHDKKFHVSNFIYVVLGVSLLVLSHPFTALITVAAAALFIVSDICLIIPLFKDWRNIACLVLSIILILGLVAFYFFPMQQAVSTGYYVISDPVAMWTDVDNLLNYIPYSYFFSGLLNPDWLLNWGGATFGETPATWMLDIILFLVCSGGSIFVLNYLDRKEKGSFSSLFAIMIALLPLVFTRREEVVLAITIFILALLFVHQHKEEKDMMDNGLTARILKKTAFNPEFYVILIVLVFGFLYLFGGFMWESEFFAPAILRNCQFPFRFWGLVQFFVIMLLLYIAVPFLKFSYVREIGIALACFTLVVCMGPVDKRIAYASSWNSGALWDEPNISYVQACDQIGVMNEYMPNVFYDDAYHSKYANSLYPILKKQIRQTHQYNWDPELYIVPAVLEGEMSIEVGEINSPNVNLHVTVNSDEALYQLQQFYYDGYRASYTGTSTFEVEGEYVDGLVAFKAKKGEYDVKIEFIGSKAYRVFRPIFYVSAVGVAAMGLGFGVLPRITKRKAKIKLKGEAASH